MHACVRTCTDQTLWESYGVLIEELASQVCVYGCMVCTNVYMHVCMDARFACTLYVALRVRCCQVPMMVVAGNHEVEFNGSMDASFTFTGFEKRYGRMYEHTSIHVSVCTYARMCVRVCTLNHLQLYVMCLNGGYECLGVSMDISNNKKARIRVHCECGCEYVIVHKVAHLCMYGCMS
jgi:hypothetical protein